MGAVMVAGASEIVGSAITFQRAGVADCMEAAESLAWELLEVQRQRILPP